MEKTFKELIERLEVIAETLENGDCDLEKAMELYEEGIKISRECNKKLTDARQIVAKLGEEE